MFAGWRVQDGITGYPDPNPNPNPNPNLNPDPNPNPNPRPLVQLGQASS